MAGLVLRSSDLVLAAGISFWCGVVETHRIQDIQDCYQIITALRGFLRQNKGVELKSDKEERGFNAENNEGNILKVQEEDNKCEVDDPVPVKPLMEADSITDETDLDDLFEVIDPTEEIATKIKEERNDLIATEESRSEDIVQVKDVRVAGENVEVKTKPEEKLETQSMNGVEGKVKKKKKRPVLPLPKQCDYCGNNYHTFTNLKQHVSLDHSERLADFDQKHQTYPCALCPYKTYSKGRLSDHMKKSHAKDAKCRLCDLAFYTEEGLRRHETTHENEGKKFPCKKCGKYFLTVERMRLHLATLKCNVLVTCAHCPKIMRRQYLKKHLATHDDSLYCKTCSRRFLSKDKMMLHTTRCELGQTKVKCSQCELLFSSSSKRSKHQFQVHDMNAHLCPTCGQKCNGLKKLKIHIEGTHGTPKYSCQQCEKKFRCQLYLDRHCETVHQSDSEKRYPCSYSNCTRAFPKKQSLESHMNCHLGIKPYQCDVCDTRFQNSSNKQAHMRNVHHFAKSNKKAHAIE